MGLASFYFPKLTATWGCRVHNSTNTGCEKELGRVSAPPVGKNQRGAVLSENDQGWLHTPSDDRYAEIGDSYTHQRLLSELIWNILQIYWDSLTGFLFAGSKDFCRKRLRTMKGAENSQIEYYEGWKLAENFWASNKTLVIILSNESEQETVVSENPHERFTEIDITAWRWVMK